MTAKRKVSTNFREAMVFLALVVIMASVIVAQIYDQVRSEAFLTAFNEHTKEMNMFLDGWVKYKPLVTAGKAKIQLDAENGTLEPFSCEAVFVRQHHVIIAGKKDK